MGISGSPFLSFFIEFLGAFVVWAFKGFKGTLASRNIPNEDNMFLYYENLGTKDMHVYVIRIFIDGDKLRFKEEKVF